MVDAVIRSATEATTMTSDALPNGAIISCGIEHRGMMAVFTGASAAAIVTGDRQAAGHSGTRAISTIDLTKRTF